MVELNELHAAVLERYSRSIVHMRKQLYLNRFGLVFGAGLSQAFGIPSWGKLVKLLASDPDVQGQGVLTMVPPRTGLPYRTEMLFEHYKRRQYDTVVPDQHHSRQLDYRISADWREIVRKTLYAGVTSDLATLLNAHPYLKTYLPLIQRTHMTVTYNFDDFIEQSLLKSRPRASSRGFESVTNPWTQFRRTHAIIYHPSGVVPQNALETPSDRFVFSEASYAEQMMGIFAGDQAGLLNHLSKHTCLLIGLSLEDETLRSLLMQGARSCPGNFHYYVHYLKDGETLDHEKQQATKLANFKVYNLITLFLHDDEIQALGELVDDARCPEDRFCDFAAEQGVPVRFRFYITGALGVGKSTTINNFRNLVVLDEWLEQRPAILAKDWEQLTDTEKNRADQWIINQFRRKNQILRNEREGIFMMDRGPLDPLSFTPDDEWSAKAGRLLAALCRDEAPWEVEDGRVILLQGDGAELSLRMLLTERKDYTAAKLDRMEERLGKAYGDEGVVRFDTRGLTPSDVARRVAEIVHLEEYVPVCNLHRRLEEVRNEASETAAC